MPCYNSMYSTPSNVYAVLNEYADVKDPSILKELNELFNQEFGEGKLSIRRWKGINNGVEMVHTSIGEPHWTNRNANVIASIYPNGNLGIKDKQVEKLKKVEKILIGFSQVVKHNNKLKRLLLTNTEKSLNKMGIKQKNTMKQVKKPLQSFSSTFKIPDAIKNEAYKKLKQRGR